MSRIRMNRGIGAVLLALALSGCAVAGAPVQGSATSGAITPIPSASLASEPPALSEFEQQLPLSGSFVSQASDTTGTARIERRADGSVWVTLEGFRTGDASDLRLYLKTDPLLQDSNGHWGSSESGFEIASIDPTAPTQEIEVPGAWTMPAIRTLTVMNYVPPDFPAFGSAALG